MNSKRNMFVAGGVSVLAILLGAGWAIAQYNGLYDGSFPLCQDVSGQHLNWNGNLPGGGPVCGSTGAAISAPNSRTLSLATAFQATDNTKPAAITINLSSTAALSLTAGQTHTADIVIGSTNAVAGGTGTTVCRYNNSLTGTLVAGLAINTASAYSCTVELPAGWFAAVRQTSGTISIVSAYDQSIG